jgi:hypothetical protein
MPILPTATLNLNVSDAALYVKSDSAPAFLYGHEMMHVRPKTIVGRLSMLSWANGATAFSSSELTLWLSTVIQFA